MSGNTLVVSGENSNGKYTKNLTFDCDKDCFLGISYEMPNLIIKMPFHKSLLASLKEIKGERNMTMNALGGIFGNSSQQKSDLLKMRLNSLQDRLVRSNLEKNSLIKVVD